jgi:peptidoglycan/xylan/chitin deacetylase (PgdA/CDA1 family)
VGWLGVAVFGAGIAAAAWGPLAPAVAALVAGGVMAQALLLDLWPVKVPVVMLHSVVGPRPDKPALFPIWCPPPHFESFLKYLRRRGYNTVTLEQVSSYLRDGTPLPPKPIVLTFDDGYADNWVYAAPLLAKYGFRGTIFVATDFIEPTSSVRSTIRDVWEGRCSEEDLEPYGYLSEGEIRKLAESGVCEIQSHGKTHTWLPRSEKVIGFHSPDPPPKHLRWMWWNRHPERKPYWFHEASPDGIPYGAPIYDNHLALAGKAVTPDPGLEEHLTSHVAARGGARFFDREGWRGELEAEVASYRRSHPAQERVESDEALQARLRDELVTSRTRLEALTEKPVRFMCWPNGGWCREAFDLLGECGYVGETSAARGRQHENEPGSPWYSLGRVSATSFFRDTRQVWPWTLSFALKIERNRGNRYMEIPIKAIWLYRRLVPASGSLPVGAQE